MNGFLYLDPALTAKKGTEEVNPVIVNKEDNVPTKGIPVTVLPPPTTNAAISTPLGFIGRTFLNMVLALSAAFLLLFLLFMINSPLLDPPQHPFRSSLVRYWSRRMGALKPETEHMVQVYIVFAVLFFGVAYMTN